MKSTEGDNMKLSFKLLAALLSLLCTSFAVADDHAAGPMGYGQSFGIKTANPEAVVAAMSKLRGSRSHRKSPSNVVLGVVVSAGESEATHFITVFYDSAADMDKANAINRDSKEFAEFVQTMNGLGERQFVNLFTTERANVKEGAVTSKNPVTMVYGLAVTDPGTFTQAFDKLWASEAMQGFPGNSFFGTSVVNGDSDVTHWVSFQANDMETLLTGVRATLSSADMAEYLKTASSARTVAYESIGAQVMTWPAAGN
ncbi:MAG: hypothetical protein ACR2PZ_13495 [Pseudomonadales bacterium]